MEEIRSTDGTTIAFDQLGEGPAIVLVAGASCDRAVMLEEPEERFYGVDAAFRDPFGNHWRLTQRKEIVAPPA